MSRERDHQLEQALKRELRAAGTPGAQPALRSFSEGGCIDAETLGAWADGGLDAAQMSAVELHVSTCARCQAIAGVAARSAPAIAPAVNEGWFRFPKWAIAPLAAAAALTIWMVVPQDTMQAPPAPAEAPIEEARKDALPGRDAANQSRAKELAEATAPAPPKAATGSFAEGKRERAVDAPATLADRQQRAEERADAALGATAATPAPAAVQPAPAAPAQAEAMLQKSSRFAAAQLEIISPDPASRWRIVNGAIERSEDSGASWVPMRAPGGEAFTGGTSPARSVCWLIGSSGLVMVTADGVAFARVPLSERVDLTAITATDARRATVTTADGRRFRTDDSGRTWRQI